MKLKPSLDVENIEDFKKYYEGSYVRVRDGRIYHIREVAVRSQQIVLQEGKEGIFEELSISQWNQLASNLRFGRYYPGMFLNNETLMYISDSLDRTFTRGLNFQEVSCTRLIIPCTRPRATVSPEAHTAWYALNQDYLINPTPDQIWADLDLGKCVVLSRFIGCGEEQPRVAAIYVRDQKVGVIDIPNRIVKLVDSVYANVLGRIFKREVQLSKKPNKKTTDKSYLDREQERALEETRLRVERMQRAIAETQQVTREPFFLPPLNTVTGRAPHLVVELDTPPVWDRNTDTWRQP